MSLLVWLPLTDRTNYNPINQGVDDCTFTLRNNHKAIYANDDGLTCYCLERLNKGGSYNDFIRSSKNFNLTGDISMFCWLYVFETYTDRYYANGVITNHNHVDYSGVGLTVRYISASDYRISCSTGTGSSRTYDDYYGTTNIKSQWHHCGLTYNRASQTLKLWVDGNVEYTLTGYNNYAASNPFDLFNWSTGYVSNSDHRALCRLNDVRLYDHELSQKEIKELAKGLTTHFALNGQGRPKENLLPDTFVNEQSYTYPSSSYSDKWYKASLIALTSNLYTLSFYAKSTVDGDKLTCYFYSPNTTTGAQTNQGAMTTRADGEIKVTLSTRWEHYWIIYSQSTTTTTKHVICPRLMSGDGTGTVSIKLIKLEEGATPTAWMPNADDTSYLYYNMDYSDSSAYDVSGYINPSTTTATKMSYVDAISYPTDSARYSVATHLINGSYFMSDIDAKSFLPTDEITVSIWGRFSSWGATLISCTEGGGWNFETNGNGVIQFPVYVDGVGYKTAVSGVTAASLADSKWHMFTGSFSMNTQNVKIYIDGVLKATASTGSGNRIKYASNRLIIGGEAQTTTPASSAYTGDLSDCRIYSRALSDADIKELYSVGASISNAGTVHGYEFIEQ